MQFKSRIRAFLSEGQSLIKELHKREFKIFLDLKLHDIPNTVKKAINVICDYGIWMTNVHVLGGKEMLASAKQVVKKESPETKLIGVTILTSLNDDLLKPLGFSNSVEETVYNFATYVMKLVLMVLSAQLVKQYILEKNS